VLQALRHRFAYLRELVFQALQEQYDFKESSNVAPTDKQQKNTSFENKLVLPSPSGGK